MDGVTQRLQKPGPVSVTENAGPPAAGEWPERRVRLLVSAALVLLALLAAAAMTVYAPVAQQYNAIRLYAINPDPASQEQVVLFSRDYLRRNRYLPDADAVAATYLAALLRTERHAELAAAAPWLRDRYPDPHGVLAAYCRHAARQHEP